MVGAQKKHHVPGDVAESRKSHVPRAPLGHGRRLDMRDMTVTASSRWRLPANGIQTFRGENDETLPPPPDD
jgi:hypothetical protein